MLLLGRGVFYDDARVPDRSAERFVSPRVRVGYGRVTLPVPCLTSVDPQKMLSAESHPIVERLRIVLGDEMEEF